MNNKKKFIINKNSIYYFKTGKSKPVLMLHGIPGDSENLIKTSRMISMHGFCSIIPDRIGHGMTPFIDYKNNEDLMLYHDLIKSINNDKKIYLLGYSYGCYTSLRFALNYPDIVKSIILISPFIFSENKNKDNDFFIKLLKNPVIKFIFNIVFKSALKSKLKSHYRDVFYPQEPSDIIDKLSLNYSSIDSLIALIKDKMILNRNPVTDDQIGNIKSRILIIAGEKDKICNSYEQGLKIKSNKKDSFIDLINDQGHGIVFTSPKSIANIIMNHIKKGDI